MLLYSHGAVLWKNRKWVSFWCFLAYLSQCRLEEVWSPGGVWFYRALSAPIHTLLLCGMPFVYAFEKEIQYGTAKFMQECMCACVKLLAALQTWKKQNAGFLIFFSLFLSLMAVLISIFIQYKFGFATHWSEITLVHHRIVKLQLVAFHTFKAVSIYLFI